MDYTLKAKKQGKWWIYGNVKKNQYGNLQASLKISDLKELISDLEKEGKSYIYLSLFENTQNQRPKVQESYQSYDDIPY